MKIKADAEREANRVRQQELDVIREAKRLKNYRNNLQRKKNSLLT